MKVYNSHNQYVKGNMKINIKKVWSGKSIFIFLRPQNEKGLPEKEQKREVFKSSKKSEKSNL
jgi:hypothetical protein